MAFRTSVPELNRPERNDRWERDRSYYEQDRERDGRYEDVRRRFEEDDDHVYRRGPAKDASDRRRRFDEDDVVVRESRRVSYDDEPQFIRRRPSPPDSEIDRRVFVKRGRERPRSPSPPRPRRPAQMLRRQSSLDTFDRKPTRYHEREYSPPRRDDYRAPPYTPIPLPRSKALPPPRMYAERDFYEEIQVSDPHRYGDDEFRGYPERVREKEVVRTRRRRSLRRSLSRSSRTSHHRSSSRRSSSRASSASSSSSGGTSLTATTRSEYPKKGKTRIPARLVSKRALIDLGYPFVEEGNVVIVQKALGQQNIDDLLKLSDEYKKSELEILAARSSAGDIDERRTEIFEVAPTHHHHVHPSGAVVVAATPAAAPVAAPVVVAPPAPVVPGPPAQHTVEFARTAVVRDVSPARSYTTSSYDSTTSYDTTTTGTSTTITAIGTGGPVIVDAHHPHHHSHALVHAAPPPPPPAREIILPTRSRHGRHSSRDLVRAERLPTGELVLYEEEVERIESPSRGVRIEKDKRGRMSISVPRNR